LKIRAEGFAGHGIQTLAMPIRSRYTWREAL
jgi:hypothetical protein